MWRPLSALTVSCEIFWQEMGSKQCRARIRIRMSSLLVAISGHLGMLLRRQEPAETNLLLGPQSWDAAASRSLPCRCSGPVLPPPRQSTQQLLLARLPVDKTSFTSLQRSLPLIQDPLVPRRCPRTLRAPPGPFPFLRLLIRHASWHHVPTRSSRLEIGPASASHYPTPKQRGPIAHLLIVPCAFVRAASPSHT